MRGRTNNIPVDSFVWIKQREHGDWEVARLRKDEIDNGLDFATTDGDKVNESDVYAIGSIVELPESFEANVLRYGDNTAHNVILMRSEEE